MDGKGRRTTGSAAEPVMRVLPARGGDAVAIFLRLRRQGRPSFLLESAPTGGKSERFSFIGTDPFARLRVRGGRAFLKTEKGPERGLPGNPFRAIERSLARYRAAPATGLPPFAGGAVGFLAYEMARHMEPALDLAPSPGDEARLGIYRDIVAVDHSAGRVLIVANVLERERRREAEARAAVLERRLSSPLPGADRPPIGGGDPAAARPMLGKGPFLERVARLKRRIRAGDIFQAVLSERLTFPFSGDPFAAYLRLRRLNPSPYLFYVEDARTAVLGSSPETLVRVDGDRVETCPIAGTRPRGAGLREDRRLARNLRASRKEGAEHLMLVDLARNDVGRVALPGSVEVPQFRRVERYSHVMHLVSRVRGRLSPRLAALDALAACFPAGTLAGAPKIRAMQLLAGIEPEPRGPFGGAVLYADFRGNLDAAIAIRTLVVEKGRAGRPGTARAQAGAGVVFDSRPEREHAEVMDKMEAVLAAVKDPEEARETRVARR